MNRRELAASMLRDDARTLDRAAAVVRRRKVRPQEGSRAAFARALEVEARMLRLEADEREREAS